MKKSSCLNTIIITFNAFVVGFSIVSYALSYVFLESFLYFLFLGLLPVFIILNICFVVYWSIKKRIYFLISLVVLLLGQSTIKKLFNLSYNKPNNTSDKVIKVMTYNVRLFNTYKSIPSARIGDDIIRFVKREAPDIVCFQEYNSQYTHKIENFPYHYVYSKSNNMKTGQAIFSKYPIIKRGSLDFKNTLNNTIYADIQLPGDTIRFYNVHLESLRISQKLDCIALSNSQEMADKIIYSFEKQKTQTDIIKAHYRHTKHKKIVCGDFNNTAFSYVYRQLRQDMKDSFEECGNGFGETFRLWNAIPLRIDFILMNNSYSVLDHRNYAEKYSDHYAVMAKLKVK